MGFVMAGLEADPYDRAYSDRQLLGRIAGYLRPVRARLALVTALAALTAIVDAALPLLFARGIDALGGGMGATTRIVLVGAILGAGTVSWTCTYARQVQTARLVGALVWRLRVDAFTAALACDLAFYDEHPAGKVVSRVTADTDDVATVVTLTLNVLSQLLLVALIIGVLLALDARLAVVALAVAPLVIGIALSFRAVSRRLIRRALRASARLNAAIEEMMGGITVVQAFGQEARLYAEFHTLNRHAYTVTIRSALFSAALFPLLVAVTNVAGAVILFAGGLRVMDGHLTTGAWFLFVQAVGLYWFPLTSIASFWSQMQHGLAASERVFALIDAEPRVRQIDHRPVTRITGMIEFRDVRAHYRPGEPVLQNVTLTIRAGETVALVGHSGAGKSTLGKLVARFYEFQGGQVLIDGQDIRTLDLLAYRRHLGLVPQTPTLVSGTVRDNIRFARPDADEAAIVAVVAAIGGGEWIADLPAGLDTAVGEGGRALSLGQRQLVALARVLLHAPSIAILDEATARVDPLTEAHIQEALGLLLRGRTTVVIAHRLSTIMRADRIVVLREGRIVAEGTHEELLQGGGYYAYLFNTYFRHQAPGYTPGRGTVPVALPEAEHGGADGQR